MTTKNGMPAKNEATVNKLSTPEVPRKTPRPVRRIATTAITALALLIVAAIIVQHMQPAVVSAESNNMSDAYGITNVTSDVSLKAGHTHKAPLDDRFVHYLQDHKNKRFGLVPLPINLSHIRPSVSGLAPSGLPASYDLRALGRVTDARYQGCTGSCWDFATYSSLESCLLPGERCDFSENNLKNTHGYDLTPDDGGNQLMSTAYLVRWSGPVNESDDPYDDTSSYSPPGLPVSKHVQDVLFIADRNNALDNDNIKFAIKEYGAVYTTLMGFDGTFYNSTSFGYYYAGDGASYHAVALVGWDDNYDKNNFTTSPRGNGAFIAKNSWGPEFGDHGYFYISYYDPQIGVGNAVYTAEPVTNYDHIYQYDPLGFTDCYGFDRIASNGSVCGSDNAWFANVFRANGNEKLSATGFYTPQSDSRYEIRVIKDGLPVRHQAGTIIFAGYHTIPLDAAVPLERNSTFRIEVNLTSPGYYYPVSIEEPIEGYSSKATANASESFVSKDGVSWQDLTGISPGSNVCLKAYTRD